MNKIERMKAVFANETPDYTPAGFWCHYPAALTAREAADRHLALYHQLDNDIIKVMDDCFGRVATKDIRIEKPSDWRNIRLPGRDCAQYRKMEELTRILVQEAGSEVMIFPTMWSPFKMASFTYLAQGSDDPTFMRHCAEDPDSVLAGIRMLADMLEDWAAGYMEAGASGIYYSAQFSEPQRFDAPVWEKLVRPSDLQVLNRVKAMGGYNIVHICGEVEFGYRSGPERYAGYPADLFNWDTHRTDITLEKGRELFGTPILGGLDNHGLLINGTLQEIREESRKIIDGFGRRGFMLGADCTVPSDIDIERLKTAVNAAKE